MSPKSFSFKLASGLKRKCLFVYGWENKKYIFTKQKVQFREGVFMLTKSPNHKMFHGITAYQIE